MTYTLPEPKVHGLHAFTAAQMHEAYAAGRQAGLEEAAVEVEGELLNWDEDRLITALAKYIRNLKETK
jgi:hypothetical protein